MDNDTGLDSDEEFELDIQLANGDDAEIRFVLPEWETVEQTKRRRAQRKRKTDITATASGESSS